VFLANGRPGFDGILGNPPWDKVKPDRKEFYGRHDVLIRAFVGGELDRRVRELQSDSPGLDKDFETYEQRVKTLAGCLKKGGDYRFQDWEVDGKSTGGDPDAFKFFVERAWRLVREGGRVGFVVPSAIYNNEGCTGLRHLLLEQAQVERFYAFENRKKVFPIDSRYKFVSLVFRKGHPDGDGFPAAFMRHDLAELADPAHKDFMVLVRRSELERLSPGTLAFLEYRHPRDREILLKMYGYDGDGNPVNPRPLLGDQGPGTWNARFYTEFHMTNARDLWTDPKTSKLYNPRQILGTIAGTTSEPPYYDPRAWPEIRTRMAEKGFWPLYEGKHIEQFLVDIRPIDRWVSLDSVSTARRATTLPKTERSAFRRIGANTNERTFIAACIPPNSFASDDLVFVDSTLAEPPMVCSLLNTFVADFALRLRGGMTHVDQHLAKKFPVPNVEHGHSIATRSAGGNRESVYEASDLWLTLWEINRATAEAYGISPDDLTYVVSSFPVFARKRPRFFEFLGDRLRRWASEPALPTTIKRYTRR
jgi:hypothetical protein